MGGFSCPFLENRKLNMYIILTFFMITLFLILFSFPVQRHVVALLRYIRKN